MRKILKWLFSPNTELAMFAFAVMMCFGIAHSDIIKFSTAGLLFCVAFYAHLNMKEELDAITRRVWGEK